jgi:hypothetical protein
MSLIQPIKYILISRVAFFSSAFKLIFRLSQEYFSLQHLKLPFIRQLQVLSSMMYKCACAVEETLFIASKNTPPLGAKETLPAFRGFLASVAGA